MESNTNYSQEIISPSKCKFSFKADNTAVVPLKNHRVFQGAIYTLLAQADPPYMYAHKKSSKVKPWSFSLMRFREKPEMAERVGFHVIKEGMRGYFYLKSIDPKIRDILKAFSERRDSLYIGKLKIKFHEINVVAEPLCDIEPELDTVTIRLETPTLFYDSYNNNIEEFTIETFFNHQCEKFKHLGIVNIDPEQLYPYMWIIENNTRESRGYITNEKDPSCSIALRGVIGDIKFKIVGNPLEKSIIWKILFLSQFTGIGVRTSMGFGYNNLLYYTCD